MADRRNTPGTVVETTNRRDGPKPVHYRFGSVAFTLEEIEECGRRHGVDGICYYPPSRWGGAVSPAALAFYDRGFKAGRLDRRRFGMVDLDHFKADPKLV